MAVDPARDRSRLAATSAVLGLALAIAGALAVTMIDRSASDVLDTPSAFGTDWDLEVNEAAGRSAAMMEATLAEPIEALSFQYAVAGTDFRIFGPTGSDLAQPFAFDDQRGSIGPFIDDGRLPIADDDVVIGARFAATIGAEVGDDITLEPTGETFRVAGIGRANDGDDTDVFVVTTMGGLERLGSAGGAPQLTAALVRVGDAGDATVQRLRRPRVAADDSPVEGRQSRVRSVPSHGCSPSRSPRSAWQGSLHALLVAVTRRSWRHRRGSRPRVHAPPSACHDHLAGARHHRRGDRHRSPGRGRSSGGSCGSESPTAWVRSTWCRSHGWRSSSIPATALAAVTAAAAIIGYEAARLQPAAVLRSE